MSHASGATQYISQRAATGGRPWGALAGLLLALTLLGDTAWAQGPAAGGEAGQTQGQAGSAQQPPPPAPPQEAPQEAPPAPPPAAPIGFRLENADLLQVIHIIAGELKLNYVVDPAVKGTVTISTAGELRREDLLPLLETILKINGATAIPTGNFYRIVPLPQAPKSPLQVSTDPTGAALPADDRMMMQILPLRFVSAGDMGKVLTPFLSDGGSVVVHESGNLLVLVDNSLNLKRLLDILAQFDNPAFAQQRVRLFPVHNNAASSLVPELEAIFSAYGLSEKASPLRFLSIDRINALLVVAADPAAYAEVELWIAKLDQPASPSGVQTFIYRVQHSEADYLTRLLTSIHGEAAPPAAEGRAGAAPQLFGSGLRIIPDSVNNTLIIQGTPQQYSQLLSTLKEIDVVPRQVLIEARLYEVTLTGDLSFGVSYFLQQRSNALRQGTASFTAAGGLEASAGLLIGNTRELLGFLNASDNRQRVRVVSAPTVLATDNSEAKIQVGSEVPILTSQAVTGAVTVGATNVFTNTIQNRDTGIILTVTPRITATGLVSLQIAQEISSAQAPPSSAIQSPTFLKRLITTRAVVQDGETIALGGLIQDSITTSRNRIPLLGDIPGLGYLFGTTSRSKEKTELIVLLTPRIVPDTQSAREAARELREKLGDLRQSFKKDKLLNPTD